jgi:hypothetical protein
MVRERLSCAQRGARVHTRALTHTLHGIPTTITTTTASISICRIGPAHLSRLCKAIRTFGISTRCWWTADPLMRRRWNCRANSSLVWWRRLTSIQSFCANGNGGWTILQRRWPAIVCGSSTCLFATSSSAKRGHPIRWTEPYMGRRSSQPRSPPPC